ncbi:unnamed protein product [Fusarium graminearum]|nr:unnamed protein product [Fusarium graminearum]
MQDWKASQKALQNVSHMQCFDWYHQPRSRAGTQHWVVYSANLSSVSLKKLSTNSMLPNYYDPDDDVLPKGSPLLQPVQVRIKLETPDGPADELDPEDLDKPWSPALLDRKRLIRKFSNRLYKRMRMEDKARMDWALVHHMSGKDPDMTSAEAREPLPSNDPGWRPPSNLRRPRKRRVLPLVLQDPLGITVKLEACADSGSDENIISLEVARQMKLQIRPEGARQFALANGKVVEAVGSVKLDCGFAVGTPLPSDTVACLFYVFNTLAVPLIMGMGFLTKTKTLSEHTDRLIEQVVSKMQALKVNSVGNTKCSAPCRLNDLAGHAVVDTGSDLNFVHPRIVEQGKFVIEPASVYLEFADCSIGTTSGVINTTFSIGCEDKPKLNRSLADQQFYILDNLNTDILIGQNTTEDLQVMTSLHEALAIVSAGSAVNIIRLKGNLEQRIRDIGRHFRNVISTSSQQKDDDTNQVGSTELQAQRENAQMEEVFENAIITQLLSAILLQNSNQESDTSSHHESNTSSHPRHAYAPSTAATYDSTATSIVNRISDTGSTPGSYSCAVPGCNATPFQNQYLLNAHMEIHQSARPYVCSFQGCPRSEVGKGYETMMEMIRHQSAHDSSGHICPFCPDREHRYPRPDNLRR